MSIGTSGRIVIEVNPDLKRDLYSALTRDGVTLKDWFLRCTESYLSSASQLALHLAPSEDLARPRAPGKSIAMEPGGAQ